MEPAAVDLSRLREIADGDRELERGLIETFIESGRCALADIEAGLAADDAILTRRAAHSLKGSSANMGAQGLNGAAAALEGAAQTGSAAELQKLSQAVSELFAATREIFERELQSFGPEP